MVGKFIINKTELTKLSTQWHTQKVALTCGSDGGLKDGIGTSGYVILVGESIDSVIHGYAVEKQRHIAASSTQQELLTQLSIEYWIAHLIDTLGEPKEQLSIQLVTDSQASILILDKMSIIVGMKRILKSDVDVAMEIMQLRHKNSHSTVVRVKVKSHITLEEAPDTVYWTANNKVDTLDILAREEVEQRLLQENDPCFLPGSRAVCSINGKFCQNELKERVQEASMPAELTNFLCTKYRWTQKNFHQIDWLAHRAVVDTYQVVQNVTVMKYNPWVACNTKEEMERGHFHNAFVHTMLTRRKQCTYFLMYISTTTGK